MTEATRYKLLMGFFTLPFVLLVALNPDVMQARFQVISQDNVFCLLFLTPPTVSSFSLCVYVLSLIHI